MSSIHDFSDKKDPTQNPLDPNAIMGAMAGMGFNPPTQQKDPNEAPEELVDMIENAKNGKYSHALFREAETQALIKTLSRKKKSNALLDGDQGVGKTQLVEELALRMVEKDPLTLDIVGDRPIYELPLSNLVAGKGIVGQLEQSLTEIIEFVGRTNAILFIDEIHQIVDNDKQTYGKIAQQLKPAMSRSDIRIIGATTTSEVTNFLKDPALRRRFSPIHIPELTIEQTKTIVENLLPSYESFHNITIPQQHRTEIIEMIMRESENNKTLTDHRPDTAITLLDTAMVEAKIRIQTTPVPQGMTKSNTLTTADVKRSTINQFQKHNATPQSVAKLKQTLAENIIGQDEVKKTVVDAISRLSLRLVKQTKPNVFLFAGPTGTGKSQIAKEIAKALYGREDAMIYLNMSEFIDKSTLTRLTGSAPGYVGSDDNTALPLESLNSNPYQIVLLDEIEKAHQSIKRFFMQAWDEGFIQMTRRNNVVDCSKAIFICTTNAGAKDFNKQTIGFGNTNVKSNKEVSEILQNDFEPEILNRITYVSIFDSISENDYAKILAIQYNKIIKEANELHPEYTFTPQTLDPTNKDDLEKLSDIVKETYNPEYNGRPAEKSIHKHIEDIILANPTKSQFQIFD